MRVAAVGWLATTIEDVDRLAEAQAAVSHDHPDAIAASKAVARAIFLLSRGESMDTLKSELERDFDYDLSRQAILARPRFDITAKGTAQTAITIALSSEGFEDAIREAALLGGDTDTLACIAGAIAEAIHGVPHDLERAARQRLTPDLLRVVEHFEIKIGFRGTRPRSGLVTRAG
jgi:ADP-ribosylglycohydrolase